MSEPGPKAQAAPPSGAPAQQEEGGAMWALLVGSAILVIAALLIFWPGGDAGSSGSGGAGKRGGSAGAQSLAQGGGPVGPNGEALGVASREYDPNRSGKSRLNPALFPSGTAPTSLAPPKKPKPEPTSFASASAEIAYWEKKLSIAQQELVQRATFVERATKAKENAKTSEQIETAERRFKIVEENHLHQKKIVEELEKKVSGLKEKQRQTGSY